VFPCRKVYKRKTGRAAGGLGQLNIWTVSMRMMAWSISLVYMSRSSRREAVSLMMKPSTKSTWFCLTSMIPHFDGDIAGIVGGDFSVAKIEIGVGPNGEDVIVAVFLAEGDQGGFVPVDQGSADAEVGLGVGYLPGVVGDLVFAAVDEIVYGIDDVLAMAVDVGPVVDDHNRFAAGGAALAHGGRSGF
jgi:hypothetical protein